MSHPDKAKNFRDAATVVTSRWEAIHWLRALRATAPWAALGGLAIILALRLSGLRWSDWIVGVVIVAAWIFGSWIWSRHRRPASFAALAAWDEAAGRKEMFASAEFFEAKGDAHPGEKVHIARSMKTLDSEMPKLGEQLPLPKMTWQWGLPVLLLAFAFSPLFKPQLAAEDRIIGAELAATAEEEADELEKQLEQVKEAKGLDPEEEKEYKDVVEKAKEMASKELKSAADKTTRELLEELEKRAREAEKMAKRLGGAEEKWASDEMLAEMRRHADTADLSDAIKDKDAKESAKESRKISKKLESEDLTREAQDRITDALDRTMKKATEEDHKKPVGTHVGIASKRMNSKKVDDAAAEFEKLARHFDRTAQREDARKKMDRLAKQLRKAGSKIAGKNMQGMKKMAGNRRQQNNRMNMNRNQQNMPNAMKQNPNLSRLNMQKGMGLNQNLPMLPGLQNMQLKPGQMQGKPMALSPVPGTMKGKPMAIVPGTGKPGQPKALIPIPGMGMGQQPGAGMGMGMGSMPGGQGAGQGGLQAGHGSAGLGHSKEAPLAANQNGLVGAQLNDEGEVGIRAIEGEARTEAAVRQRTQAAVDFIKVQEEALDEQNLPASRREHVRRYFNLLREKFEGESS